MSTEYPPFVSRRLSTLNRAQLDLLFQQNASVVNGIMIGKINSTGQISLEYTGSGGVNTTTVQNPMCTVNSFPYFSATNLLGANAVPTLYVDNVQQNSFDIHWNELTAGVSPGNPAILNYILFG